MTTPLRLGIAGLGTVGVGVVKIVQRRADLLAARSGRPVTISAVSARSRDKDRGVRLSDYAWEDDPVALAKRDDVDVFVELMGGSDGPAKAATEAAIAAGKDVVTANKAMLAIHGQALAAGRRKRRVRPAVRGRRRGRHPGGQGPDRGSGRQRGDPCHGRDERHLQLHPDPDGGRAACPMTTCSKRPATWAISRPTRRWTSAASTPVTSWRCWPPSPSAPRSSFDAMELEGIERISHRRHRTGRRHGLSRSSCWASRR